MAPVILFVFPFACVFVFGLIIGSFLNVVGLRYRSGVGLGGRSFCVVCRRTLRWYELVPLVSFLAQGGKCTECRTPVSRQYPAVELWTGLLFLTLYYAFGFSAQFVLAASAFCVYVVIVIYDVRHKIIPDELALTALVLAAGFRLFQGGTLLDWLAGPILALFFYLVWKLSRGRATGLGDAKLSLSIGLLAGFSAGLSAFALAFWIGTAYALVFLIAYPLFRGRKGLTMKSEMPFAPYLVLGAWLALIFHADLFHLTSLLH